MSLWVRFISNPLEDNTGAEKWVTETAMTKKKRHIRIYYHFIRDEVLAGRIQVQRVPTEENPADGLTKPLDRQKFERWLKNMNLETEGEPPTIEERDVGSYSL